MRGGVLHVQVKEAEGEGILAVRGADALRGEETVAESEAAVAGKDPMLIREMIYRKNSDCRLRPIESYWRESIRKI